MNAPEDIAKGDLSGRLCQKVTAFFAALALDDLFGFQLDKNLHQIVYGYALFDREIISANRSFFLIMARQSEYGPRRVITLDR